MSEAYPLHWPESWPRTPADKRQSSRFRTTIPRALKEVQEEVSRLRGKALVISSNVTLGQQSPRDPGVAAYFELDGERVCIPCDRWSKVEDNLHAIGLTIEALRGIERWGAKHMVRAAFKGFATLPPPPEGWRGLLDNPGSLGDAEVAYRSKCKDAGSATYELNAAIEQARKELTR